MATSSEQPSTATASANSPSQPTAPETESAERSITPVEMRTLSSTSGQPQLEPLPISSTAPQLSLPAGQQSLLSQEIAREQPRPAASESAAQFTPSKAEPPATLTRYESEAIGPSTDTPIALKTEGSEGPMIMITLLLTSGARHPYKIDEKYLKKRKIEVDGMDPLNISVYTLKELILRDWRPEWESPPSSPSSIRLIHFGRMLDDKSPLKDCRFQQESPNVVHMTVKPQEVVDEEDAKTGKGGNRRGDDDETHAGCRCVIL